MGEPRQPVPDPFGDAPGITTAIEPQRLSATGPWFTIDDVGALRLDAASVAVDRALVTGPGCWIHQAAGSTDRFAAVACAGERGAIDPLPCAIVITDADGTLIGHWADDALTLGEPMWAGDRLVLGTSRESGLAMIVFDPVTGSGTELPIGSPCGSQAPAVQRIDGTTAAFVNCPTGSSSDGILVDAATGEVLRRGIEAGEVLVGPDAEPRPLGTSVVDATTGERLPPRVDPSVADAIRTDPAGEYLTGWDTPTGVWVERCFGACPPWPEQVELVLFDREGAVRGSWPLATHTQRRGMTDITSRYDVVIDATGAWIPVDGRIVRVLSSP